MTTKLQRIIALEIEAAACAQDAMGVIKAKDEIEKERDEFKVQLIKEKKLVCDLLDEATTPDNSSDEGKEPTTQWLFDKLKERMILTKSLTQDGIVLEATFKRKLESLSKPSKDGDE